MQVAKRKSTNFNKYIPKEAYGYNFTSYAIALEGWRRGLNLRYLNINELKLLTEFTLSDDKEIIRFSSSRGNLVSLDTINLCANKYKTKTLLEEKGINVLEGEFFNHDVFDEEIIKYVDDIGYPVVVKPHDGFGGTGVILNIQDKKELKHALAFVRRKLQHRKVIVERYLSNSTDYQLYLIDSKVVAAIERRAPFIIGDGEKTIYELINEKNIKRRNNPGLRPFIIQTKSKEIQRTLKRYSYNLNTVLKKNEKVYLSDKRNFTIGGDSIDVTDDVPNYVKKLAIKAFRSIPDLSIGVVEVLVDQDTKTPYVLEIKTKPSLVPYSYPVNGKTVDLPRKIIDYYFPHTNHFKNSHAYYFDIGEIDELFQSNLVSEYVVKPLKNTDVVSRKIVLEHLSNVDKFSHMLKEKLLNLSCDGHINIIKNKAIELIVAGSKSNIEELKSFLDLMNSQYEWNFNYQIYQWYDPVCIGVKIHKDQIEEKTSESNILENEESKSIFRKLLQRFNF